MTTPQHRFLIIADGEFGPLTSKTANSCIRYFPERIVAVLDRTQEAQELRIFIGAESGIVEPDLAIVAAPYRLNGEVVGALGVIGPTRMDYSRVVPLVELTARTVGLTLEET